MRVLACAENIFSTIGGGQSFYADLIGKHPEHEFWYFSHDPQIEVNVPVNAHILSLSNVYRLAENDIDLSNYFIDGFAIKSKKYDLLYLLDLASAVPEIHFDVVDIPDYMGYGTAFPAALKALSVRFDRVAISLHGTLSMGVCDNWGDIFSNEELVHLRYIEDLLFKAADIRYAISRRYLSEREEATGVKGRVLDLTHLIPTAAFRSLRNKGRQNEGATHPSSPSLKPAIAFIGRQEKWKGPDLFIDTVSGLPAGSYSSVLLVGPAVKMGGVNSADRLTDMARRRGLSIEHRSFQRNELWTQLATSRWVGVFPSRRDTLNLAALETLLTGTPALISIEAGVVDFLDRAYPGIPFERIDPSSLASAKQKLVDLLADFDGYRERLITYLETNTPRPTGEPLGDIYASRDTNAASEALYEQFLPIFRDLVKASSELARTRVRHLLRSKLSDIYQVFDKSANGEFVDYLMHGFEQGCELRRIDAELRSKEARVGFIPDEQIEAVWEYLEPFCYGINRVPLYKILARLEKNRGNNVLYATYQLRAMRLSGSSTPEALKETCEILRAAGFVEEAQAAEMMYGANLEYDRARDYLFSMPKRFTAAPTDGISLTIDERVIKWPRVSIIVSLYQAGDKLPVFFDGLSRLSASTKEDTEIVLVDSNSQDDTTGIVRRLITQHRNAGWNPSVLYVRTDTRETIQCAWNRGIAAAKGKYLSFLGVDEMNHPDSYDIMADYLDEHSGVDWVQGTALVTEVNMGGSFVQDLMLYDRRFDYDFMNIFDTCYIGYVGALCRRNIHERVGFYDDRFRGAGDSEFKNRALPRIKAVTLPMCLGYFLNYPEERTTQSPMAEIEDLRAWYLYRTAAGANYEFSNFSIEEIRETIARCMNYRKSYMNGNFTDLELACSILDYVSQSRHPAFAEIFARGSSLRSARDMYRALDCAMELASAKQGAQFVHDLGEIIERAVFSLSSIEKALQFMGCSVELRFRNDNRSHQHFNIWRSQAQKLDSSFRDPLAELAGPQDFAEVFSACQAIDQNVDFERAWANNDLGQLQKLQAEKAIDIAIEWHVDEDISALASSLGVSGLGGRVSIAVIGARASRTGKPERMYFTGPVGNPGPAVAAADAIIVRARDRAPGTSATRLLRAILSGRPLVADSVSVASLMRLAPDLDLSGIDVIDDLSAALTKAAELSLDHGMRHDGSDRSRLISQITTQFGFGNVGDVGGGDPKQSLPPPDILRMNRRIREGYEMGGQGAVADLIVHSAGVEREVLRRLIASLFVDRTAAILTTAQPVFQRIGAERPAPEILSAIGG